MTTIPQQPAGRDLCPQPGCDKPIHLTNRQLDAVWVHDSTGSEWCGLPGEPATTRATPASRPWPERAV